MNVGDMERSSRFPGQRTRFFASHWNSKEIDNTLTNPERVIWLSGFARVRNGPHPQKVNNLCSVSERPLMTLPNPQRDIYLQGLIRVR